MPADAVSCAPTPGLLGLAPHRSVLPGGAQVLVYDTGRTRDPDRSVRAVVVRYGQDAPLRARVLTSGTLTTAATPAALALRHGRVLAAVDGGFFTPSRHALPVGPEMRDGVLRKATDRDAIVVAVLDDGQSTFAYARLDGTATFGGRTWPLGSINHQAVHGLSLYTSAWGPQRRPTGALDVVLDGSGRVAAVRRGTARGAVPTGSQRILTAWGAAGAALGGLRPGDPVQVDYRPVLRANGQEVYGVQAFIGTGGHYVSHGRNITGCTRRGEQLRPRTAIGWTESGDTVLATFTGRSSRHGVRWGGATNHQVGDYMAALGCVESVGLDGGTSTTMVLRDSVGGRLRRVDAGGRQLPVPEAFALEYAGS